MEITQQEQNQPSAAETAPAQPPEPLPAIVEAAFGKQEPAAPEAPAAPTAPNPALSAPAPEPEPKPKPAEGKGADKRIKQLTGTLKSKDAEIAELRAQIDKLKGNETPEAAIDRKFAENEIRKAQTEQEQAEAEIAMEKLREAIPDEKAQQEFLEMNGDFAPSIDKYAPEVSNIILASDISYKLANAFYSVLSSEPNALRDFLNQPKSVQKKHIRQLEAYLKQPPPPALPSPPPAQAPAPIPPASVPRSIVPSESGTQPAEPEVYASTLERIAEQNRRAFGYGR